jgi:hypothetical protein
MTVALRLHNRQWFPVIFLAMALTVVVLWYLLAVGHPPPILLSGIGAVAGFGYFLYRQHLDETKLFKELFIEFNARYDKLNDELNKILTGSAEHELSESQRGMLFSYFNLCAEEYFFYKAGYIDENVWNTWSRGMNIFFSNPRIRELWEVDCRADSYYGFRPGTK